MKVKKLLSKILICLMAFSFSLPNITLAETDLSIHTRSYHTSETRYNENNLGLIWRKHVNYLKLANYYTYGAYQNSESNLSIFVGLGKIWGDDFFKFSITTGLVSGYGRSPVIPVLFPTIHIGDLNIHIIPDPVNEQVVFSFSIKILEW